MYVGKTVNYANGQPKIEILEASGRIVLKVREGEDVRAMHQLDLSEEEAREVALQLIAMSDRVQRQGDPS